MRRIFFVIFSLLFAAISAHAQAVRWEPGDSGDPADLQLIFEDCAPDGDPQLPRLEGTTLALVGTSSQMTLNNMSMSRSTILSYRARSQHSGALRIPAFTVKTNKGEVHVAAYNGGALRTGADANVTSRLDPGARTVWAGEVFPITYVLDVSRRSFSQLGTNIEWNPAPLAIEEWSKFEPNELVTNGEPRLNIIAKTRAYAKTPGAITLNAATQLVNLQSGSIGFGLFQTPRIEQLSVTSDRPSLVVRPLPSPAPAGFNGAVGQFKLTSKVVPTTAGVGEPVTWTIELSGTGNWPDIPGLPQREVSQDFNVVQPKAKRTNPDSKIFDATLSEDVVLVPTRAGEYTIGPLNYVYFDPASGSYQTIRTPETRITITAPAPTAATPTSPAPATGTGVSPAATAHHQPPAIPGAPAAIPRDPLPGHQRARVPLAERTTVVLATIPFAVLPIAWLWLAVGRARQTDPLRVQREARARLFATIDGIRAQHSSPIDAACARRLLEWQHDAAILWGVPHAAPSPAVLASDGNGPDASAETWARLWREADQAIYSARGELPAGWSERALAAASMKTLPPFRAWSALRPRNLLPLVAGLLVVLALPTLRGDASGSSSTADPAVAYRNGDFAAAAEAWTSELAAHPTDANTRYNLSLALAQLDRWGEAAAHASAALLQSPANPSIRAQLALACEKAGYVPATIAGFLPPGPLQTVAREATPATWQWLLVLSSVLCTAASVLLLFNWYHGARPAIRWTAWLLFLLAGIAGLLATGAIAAYGTTANRDAVIVWRTDTLRSIPTEADSQQKTTALPAGSVAVVDKILLGWIRLRFDNGQTGWVRKDAAIAIWH